MPEQTPNTGDGGNDDDRPGEDQGRKDGPRGPSGRGERKDCSIERMDKDKHQAKNVWMWNDKLHIIYHPRGCKICKEYGRHLLEADLEMDNNYAVANRIRRQEVDYWKIKKQKIFQRIGGGRHLHPQIGGESDRAGRPARGLARLR